MEIVYCGGCGRVLRGDDFDRGLARYLDNRPWCAECRPPAKDPIPTGSPRKQGSTAKIPRISVGTTRRETAAPPAPRRGWMGLAVAVLATAGLALLFARGGGAPPPEPVVERPRIPAPRPAPVAPEQERLLGELEVFSSLSPPDKILARCEDLAPKFRDTPQEKRFREIEEAARAQKRARERDAELAKELEAILKLIEDDPRFTKYDEVLRRLQAAREVSGPRLAEIDRRLLEYRRERRESPFEKHAGPFAEDEQGFIRNWLVLGVFPNADDKGLDQDFLGGESAADPVDGWAVGKLRWGAYASPESKVDFFRVGHLGIRKPRDWVVAYAACLLQNPEYVAAEFRLGSNDGGALWVDGKLAGKVHRPRSLQIDEDRYALPLQPGVHRILVKVEQHTLSYEFALRVLAPDGRPLPTLRIWN